MLTQEQAHSLFEYKDGVLYWRIRPANCISIGDIAGGTNGTKEPYVRVKIGKERHLIHRVIYLMHYGYMPKIVDHIDNNKSNNKIENLREVTKSQNCLNKKIRKDNLLNIKNVYFYKPNKKYAVKISINGKPQHIGYFEDLELAELVAIESRNKFHGNFARHN
jgi:hypothetical protein